MTDQERAERLAAIQARRSSVASTDAAAPAPRPGGGSPPVTARSAGDSNRGPTAKPKARPHAASGARWLVAGVSAAATVGMIGAMTSASLATASDAPESVTVVVARSEPVVVNNEPGEMAIAAADNGSSGNGTPDTGTAPATPAYTVVTAEAPAATESGGS